MKGYAAEAKYTFTDTQILDESSGWDVMSDWEDPIMIKHGEIVTKNGGDILEFGGVETFSPWYKISNSCDTNCSFVSGDSSVGFAIIILFFLTKNIFFLYGSLVFGFMLGFIRILAGGHFLSDVVFSGVIIIFLNFLIVKVYNRTNGL